MAKVTPPPVDRLTSIAQLTASPYPIYARYRKENPVVHVESVGRIMLAKAEDTRAVKADAKLFSSDDPNTPMERAFHAKTLMRRDGADHRRLRMAMAPAFSTSNIANVLIPAYQKIAEDMVSSLPRGETVDLFPALAGPVSARCLAFALGIEETTDQQMQRWSQALIDGAGNYGWAPGPFERVDKANAEINTVIENAVPRHLVDQNTSALSVMVNAQKPIEMEHIISNLKIAIGGGINEPRDALLTVLFGLLTNRDQKNALINDLSLCSDAVEEAVRWVAPIQVSSRRATQDTEIGGYLIQQDDVVMTIQASANRDEDVYEDGDVFNILREQKSHQSFGNGAHFCMGAHIARRMMSDILLPLLFDRFPNMALTDPADVVWKGFGFRGPINLPVVLK